MKSGSASSATTSSSASTTSTSMKPSASMNGSRSAATIGGTTALRTAITAATTNAAARLVRASRPAPGWRRRTAWRPRSPTRPAGARAAGAASSAPTSPPRHVRSVVKAPIMPCRREAPQPQTPAAGYCRPHGSVRGRRTRRVGRLPDGAARAARRRDRACGQVVVGGRWWRRGRGRAVREAGGDAPRSSRPSATTTTRAAR